MFTDLDEFTVCITNYVNFCVDTLVPVERVNVHPNNRPGVTKGLRDKIRHGRLMVMTGNREGYRAARVDVCKTAVDCKGRYTGLESNGILETVIPS